MTAQAFADVLQEPDSNVSHTRLHGLISAHDFSGSTLPTVAEDYLRVFCDQSVSVIRRRWVGVALVSMLHVSAVTVEHLKQSPKSLHGLGEVILSATEWEETKVIAGSIMKQGIEHGIEFSKFWASDRVKNSALNFPRETGLNWMGQFQAFLDTLSDLALMNPNADPCVLYPIMIVASDNLRQMNWDKGASIVVLQNELLTVIAPTETFKETTFIDIPISHIHSTRIRQSDLQNSQAQMTHYKPWDMVLMLNQGPWTYRLNTSDRKGMEVKLMFENKPDAQECQNVIDELRKSTTSSQTQPRQARAMMSRSSPLYVGRRSPFQTSQIAKAKEHNGAPTASEPVQNENLQHPPSHNGVARSSRPRSPLHELSGAKSLENVDGGNQGGGSLSDGSDPDSVSTEVRRPGPQQKQRDEGQAEQVITVAAKSLMIVQDQVHQQQTAAQSSRKDVSQLPSKVGLPKETRRQPEQEQSGSKENSNSVVADDVVDKTGLSERAGSIRPTPKRTTYSKGKLTSVSRAAKERVTKQVPTKTRTSVIARNRRSSNVKSMKEAGSDDESDESSIYNLPSPEKQQSHSKNTEQTTTRTSRGRKAQNRQLTDPDDDYVPEKPLSEPILKKKGASTKRKGAPDSHATVKQPTKRAKPKVKSDVDDIVDAKGSNQRNTDTEHEKQAGPIRRNKYEELSMTKLEPDPRQLRERSRSHSPKKTPVQQTHSPTSFKRHSLIEGLLQSANPSVNSASLFKKPTTPYQASQSPTTPTQSRSRSITRRPETPIESRERQSGLTPFIASSPPTWNASQERSGRLRRFAPDTEILSSNSKRLPDSPHAESTAISGHAGHADIDNEKREGDIQTAKSNPFSQRRADGKATSFIRRLTGEDRTKENQAPDERLLHVMPVELNESDISDVDDVISRPANKLPPRPRTSLKKTSSSAGVEQHSQQRFALFPESHRLTLPAKEKEREAHQFLRKSQDNATQTSQSSYSKVIAAAKEVDTNVNVIVNSVTMQTPVEVSGADLAVTHGKEPNAGTHDSILSAPAQLIEDTQMKDQDQDQAEHQDHDFDMEGDVTLVNDDREDELPELPSKASLLRFRSTLSEPGSSSSHSSTSAESDPSSDPPIPASQAEEMEWEASLEPHQRALHDLLIRASKRVLRHIVDNETAVGDIADIFATDGHHLLNRLLDRQENTYTQVFEDMNKKTKSLTTELEGVAKRLAKERKRIKAVA